MSSETDVEDADLERLLQASRSGDRSGGGRSKLAAGLWAVGSVPVVALLLLGSMAVRVRLADGAWPVRNQPDPKDLGFHNTATIVAMLASFLAAVLLPLGTLAAFFSGYRRVPIGPTVLAVVGFAALFLTLRADIGGLGDWIAD